MLVLSLKLLNPVISLPSYALSLHWLRITERIEYKILSLYTYKVLTIPNLHTFITSSPFDDQRPRSTRSSSVVTLARPPSSSTLKITDRSFRYSSPCSGINSLYLFVNLILVPVPPFSTYLFLHPSLDVLSRHPRFGGEIASIG